VTARCPTAWGWEPRTEKGLVRSPKFKRRRLVFARVHGRAPPVSTFASHGGWVLRYKTPFPEFQRMEPFPNQGNLKACMPWGGRLWGETGWVGVAVSVVGARGWECGDERTRLPTLRRASSAAGGWLGAGVYTLANFEESEQRGWLGAGVYTLANFEESEQRGWRLAGSWRLHSCQL
jgi:hypothetical protein